MFARLKLLLGGCCSPGVQLPPGTPPRSRRPSEAKPASPADSDRLEYYTNLERMLRRPSDSQRLPIPEAWRPRRASSF